MKVEINQEEKEQEVKYPCLMLNIVYGHVIYAIKDDGKGLIEGVVVASNNADGVTDGLYSNAFGKQYFTPLEGSITLSND